MRILAYVQGTFYFLTGVWPIVDINSFMEVTGPKVDIWLVKTVGVLILVIAITLLAAAYRKRISPEVILLGSTACIGFILIDVIYVMNNTILPVYLLDAAAELLILIGWILMVKRTSHKKA